MTAAEYNAQVEAERRAYHDRRCRESEGYKRVYEYITGTFQRVRTTDTDIPDWAHRLMKERYGMKLHG